MGNADRKGIAILAVKGRNADRLKGNDDRV